jgi:hypothetical protein
LNGIPVTDTYSIHARFTPGTQAYLLKRSKAKEITPLLKHDTYVSLRDKILSLKNPLITSEKQMKAFDEFGNKLLNQCILYPPVVIEQLGKSVIVEKADDTAWTKFFEGHEELRTQYWSYGEEPLRTSASNTVTTEGVSNRITSPRSEPSKFILETKLC